MARPKQIIIADKVIRVTAEQYDFLRDHKRRGEQFYETFERILRDAKKKNDLQVEIEDLKEALDTQNILIDHKDKRIDALQGKQVIEVLVK